LSPMPIGLRTFVGQGTAEVLRRVLRTRGDIPDERLFQGLPDGAAKNPRKRHEKSAVCASMSERFIGWLLIRVEMLSDPTSRTSRC